MNISSIQNQLVYTTVRITATDEKEISVGTGFFVHKKSEKNSDIFLVTNKHVVKNYDRAELVFCATKENLEPDDNNHVKITITELQTFCIKHSSLEICFIKMEEIINVAEKQGKHLFFKCIDTGMFINDGIINTLTAIEDVIMIGYPEGLIDPKNNKPVVRKGITATSLSLDFEGRKEFIIDAACFHGSSGSPIFLDQIGLYQEQSETGITIGVRHNYCFVGMLRAVPAVTVKGELKVVDVPTDKKLVSEAELMTNLGYVIKSECILEMLNEKVSNSPIPSDI